jgi:DNA-binding GntR family transcriptional regulator
VRLNSGRPGGMDDGVLRAHGRVARSIERRDADQAEQRMREHIRTVSLFMSGTREGHPHRARPRSGSRQAAAISARISSQMACSLS